MGTLKKGQLVLYNSKKPNMQNIFVIFVDYSTNAALQKEKTLSKVLLDNSLIQVPTSYLQSI